MLVETEEVLMSDTERDPEPKEDGVGGDKTIPAHPDGLAAGLSEKSNFNPEEDEESAVE